MKIVKLVAILAMMWMSFSAQAVCPVQETTVMYINGVDVKESDAQKSRKRLFEEVTKEPGIRADCLHFEYVYNTNEFIFLDWMESYFQKAGEASDWWRSYMRIETGNAVLVALFNGTTDFLADLVKTTADAGQWVFGDQKAEHLARYRTEITANGRRLVLVPHSQGNLYANEEYAELTATERANTRIVATATPASFVADNGPYVSVNEDFLASTLFAFLDALPTNTANNTQNCEGDLASINRWLCHGFKEEYMAAGKPSRDKIVNDIIAALPIFAYQYEKGRVSTVWFRNINDFYDTYGGVGSLYTPASNQVMDRVSFYMWRESSSSGNLEARVYSDTGTLLSTSAEVTGNDVTLNTNWYPVDGTDGDWITFHFPAPVSLVSGHDYLIVMHDISGGYAYYFGTSYESGFSSENDCAYISSDSPFTYADCGMGGQESVNMRIP